MEEPIEFKTYCPLRGGKCIMDCELYDPIVAHCSIRMLATSNAIQAGIVDAKDYKLESRERVSVLAAYMCSRSAEKNGFGWVINEATEKAAAAGGELLEKRQ